MPQSHAFIKQLGMKNDTNQIFRPPLNKREGFITLVQRKSVRNEFFQIHARLRGQFHGNPKIGRIKCKTPANKQFLGLGIAN